MKLSDSSSIDNVIGQITPPPGPSQLYGDPIVGIGKLFGTLLNIFMIFAGVSLLIYLLWGGVEWVMSGGDKETLSKAQMKITNALIGMLWIVVGITLFGLITGNILGIIKHTDKGWQFDIPLMNAPAPAACPGSCGTVHLCDQAGGTALSGYSCTGSCSGADCVCCSK